MNIAEYLANISDLYGSGKATEPSYYGDLNSLINTLCPECKAISNPKQIQCGAPDHIIQRQEINIGVVEDKEIGVDFDEVEAFLPPSMEQFGRLLVKHLGWHRNLWPCFSIDLPKEAS